MSKYDQTMMDTAFLWAKHGTCSRLQVGCVFARDERILVQGYNGAPKGLAHCDHECDCAQLKVKNPVMLSKKQLNDEVSILARTGHYMMCNSRKPCDRAVHAEQNGIAWAARIGVSLAGSTAYSTHQPCLVCARLIVTAGVKRVVFQEPYRLVDGLNLLNEAGLEITQLPFEMDYNKVAMPVMDPEMPSLDSFSRPASFVLIACGNRWWHKGDSDEHECDIKGEHVTHVCMTCGQTKSNG